MYCRNITTWYLQCLLLRKCFAFLFPVSACYKWIFAFVKLCSNICYLWSVNCLPSVNWSGVYIKCIKHVWLCGPFPCLFQSLSLYLCLLHWTTDCNTPVWALLFFFFKNKLRKCLPFLSELLYSSSALLDCECVELGRYRQMNFSLIKLVLRSVSKVRRLAYQQTHQSKCRIQLCFWNFSLGALWL